MRKALLVLSALFAIGCATTEFRTYEGWDNIIEGQGGTKTVVDGIDFWEDGDPPRRYKILGYVTDERTDGGLQRAGLPHDIAAKAKEVGAQAVILTGQDSRVTGFQKVPYGGVRVNQKNSTHFAVVKYLPDH
jgi:hypothetical protein